MIKFREITEENYRECMRLKVKEHQLEYVDRGNYIALSKAYVHRESAYPFAVYDDDTMIGFVQYREIHDLGNYLLDKIMICDMYQGKGYATQVMEKLINDLKRESKYRRLCLCVHKDNIDAIRLYHKFGFEQCEDEEENEIVLGIEW